MGMDTYEWQKNAAVCTRVYYSEKCFIGTTLAAAGYTYMNAMLVRNNFFKKTASAALLPVWKKWAFTNVFVIGMLLRPLTPFEIEQQFRKRIIMHKYVYTLYHLESPEEMAINKKTGNRFAIIKDEDK